MAWKLQDMITLEIIYRITHSIFIHAIPLILIWLFVLMFHICFIPFTKYILKFSVMLTMLLSLLIDHIGPF